MNKKAKTDSFDDSNFRKAQVGSAGALEVCKKIFLSLLIIAVIYTNLWVLFMRTPYGKSFGFLPMNTSLGDLFDTFAVFSYYETFNRDFSIKGFPESQLNHLDDDPDDDWVDLKIIDEYFPYNFGEQQMRMYLTRHYGHGTTFHQSACKQLAKKIRLRYNRENPNNEVVKVVIGMEFWPRSLKSYREMKRPDTLGYQVLCVED